MARTRPDAVGSEAQPTHARPRLLASRCLGFAPTRWNGAVIASAEVAALIPFADFVTVCPEVDIGLGVPRDPLRIVGPHRAERLVQPATGRDLTEELEAFSAIRLSSAGPLDGLILKSRSPSCGVKDTKVYPSAERSAPSGVTAGLFAREAARRFPELPIEDDGCGFRSPWTPIPPQADHRFR